MMKTTTKAIVLHLSKYTDRASLLHVYTQKYGRMTYMVYGIKGKKKSELLYSAEPLTIVEIEATHSTGRDIHILNNISSIYIANNILSDIKRRTISLFISEIIYRTIRHPEPDDKMFNFFEYTIKTLDKTEHFENIHLWFMLNFTYYLGIMPSLDEKKQSFEDTYQHIYNKNNISQFSFSSDEIILLSNLLQDSILSISRQKRQQLIEKLCKYYEFNLTDFFTPKSLEILKEIFD